MVISLQNLDNLLSLWMSKFGAKNYGNSNVLPKKIYLCCFSFIINNLHGTIFKIDLPKALVYASHGLRNLIRKIHYL